MAVLCGMSTIQNSARSARLFVHSTMRRFMCLRLNDASVICVLLIYIFQFGPAFLPRRSARRHSGVLGLPNIGHRTSPKIWEVSCTERTVQGNGVELIPTVKRETRHPVEGSSGSEFPAIYNHCGVMAA